MRATSREAYIDRELSWLEFNRRVLREAMDTSTPLLERVRFLGIFSRNLDEFFMVRVAGLKKLLQEGIRDSRSEHAADIGQVLAAVYQRTSELVHEQYGCFHSQIVPALAQVGIEFCSYASLGAEQRIQADEYFERQVYPVLTPLAFDPSHPFPFLSNLALYLLVVFRERENANSLPAIGFVEVPSILPRLVRLEAGPGKATYIFLGDLISAHLARLFVGNRSFEAYPIRITRNLDYNLLEGEVSDLLKSVQRELKNRMLQEAVRLEAAEEIPAPLLRVLTERLELSREEIFMVSQPLDLSGLSQLVDLDLPEHKFPPFNPRIPAWMDRGTEIFSLISAEDRLLHHPYESFYTVIELLQTAAHDPQVVAIKQTLYRTSGDSPIIDSLIVAAENGKQVTAVVELKARFDEKNNIVWARRLEVAGVNVVFGFVGLKTHGKVTLIVRREGDGLRRYVHLSTGNYNSTTAKQYVDIGFMSANEDIASDVSTLFNLLTGFDLMSSARSGGPIDSVPHFKALGIAPFYLRRKIMDLIDREIELHREKGDGHIILKLNALVDRPLIAKLYEASQEGVRIQLIVRGICCLRAGVPGLSDNITVRSIVDRFLEHSRIFYLRAGGEGEVYLSSADWMPRNMDRRVEIMFPINDPKLKARLFDKILQTYLSDNMRAHELLPDGTYRHSAAEVLAGSPVRAQERFIEMARHHGLKSAPYDVAIRHKKGRPVIRGT